MADDSPSPVTGFEGLDVSDQVLRALARMGFHEATAIQKETIPLMIIKKDRTREVYDRANEKISLSKMTFPHELVRLVFVEQLYRGFTILRHEPYHHE